ncbi:hypothetical protein [Streptomyces europaeiscabiei]|uniref:hypothetical protein n=1 Tax=Streptomyces europaeiscabiei TaxID=146819 RepID=UPI002E2BE5BD|nr:hypothetical protein [Streptomyces europaeiscabiei]
MTHRDISLLLADAADDVEIGMAPVQAVLRGGRRRRTRRWAVVAASVLVFAGSTASLAVTGLQGGDGRRGAPVATQGPTAEERNMNSARRTVLASGTVQGEAWQVFIDVWEAPRNETEAREQLAAMRERGENPGVDRPAELIGKKAFFVWRSLGNTSDISVLDVFTKESTQSGTDIESAAFKLEGLGSPFHLVIGHVAKTAQRVTCTWKDGTATEVRRAPSGQHVVSGEAAIRSAAGSPVDWFVCLAPEGKAYRSAEVTE